MKKAMETLKGEKKKKGWFFFRRKETVDRLRLNLLEEQTSSFEREMERLSRELEDLKRTKDRMVGELEERVKRVEEKMEALEIIKLVLKKEMGRKIEELRTDIMRIENELRFKGIPLEELKEKTEKDLQEKIEKKIDEHFQKLKNYIDYMEKYMNDFTKEFIEKLDYVIHEVGACRSDTAELFKKIEELEKRHKFLEERMKKAEGGRETLREIRWKKVLEKY